MKIVSARAAVEAIADGSRVVLPHGAVEPTTLYRALQECRGRFRDLHLYSGLQFGAYPFLEAGLGESFRYTTWQASARLRPLFRSGQIDLLPLRFRDVVRVVSERGSLPPDVALVQVSPPRRGRVSLGISVSLFRDFIASARLVVAEVNCHMPWTCGNSEVPVGDIDLFVESELPLGTYSPARRTPRDDAIVERLLGLVPPGAWVQLGVGAIPDAVTARLADIDGVNLYSGMLTGGLVEFVRHSRHRARVITGEVAGGPELYEFVAENAQVEFHPSAVTHDIPAISALRRFVSINSAVEVDLQGQINGETVDGVQISGVGGSLDFVEGASYSPEGCAILALPSTTEDGRRSKIVRRLGERTPVTVPRFCADWVVTELGAVRLRGLSLRERAAALVQIAHPDFREALGRE